MNIVMLTNIFTPQVGGITRSIQHFVNQLVSRAARVMVIAPDYGLAPEKLNEMDRWEGVDVVRVPAIADFYESRYPLPLPGFAHGLPELREFRPDLVHTHHPFLLGSAGHQIAAEFGIPLVYTHHTRYSSYIQSKMSWPGPLEATVTQLVKDYCNLCDMIVAPSEGIRRLLQAAQVVQPVEVIPTGVDVDRFGRGDGISLRRRLGIPANAPLVGHVGRLSREKNIDFLAEALSLALAQNPNVHLLVVGSGASQAQFEDRGNERGVGERIHFAGVLEGQELVDSYHAMNVFAFASRSETQGMVLAEAMAAGVPVVALRGMGVSDVIILEGPRQNGRLLDDEDVTLFAQTLLEELPRDALQGNRLQENCRRTAEELAIERCGEQLAALYQTAIAEYQRQRSHGAEWKAKLKSWEAFWQRCRIRVKALASGVTEPFLAEAESPQL